MTETKATYTTEPLPECETGSVEQMLQAAIEWNMGIEALVIVASVEGEMPSMSECGAVKSLTQLLRNILAKMEQATQPEPTSDSERAGIFIERSDKGRVKCPACDELVSVEVVFRY